MRPLTSLFFAIRQAIDYNGEYIEVIDIMIILG
ncbi:hypothetical protein BH10PSE12_BH10PSE12_13740 [soil metagenome]